MTIIDSRLTTPTLFFDTETSGFMSKKLNFDDPSQAWCIQIGAILRTEKEVLDKLGINYKVIETKDTALGNNLLVGENYFFCNPDFDALDEVKVKFDNLATACVSCNSGKSNKSL